MAMMNPSRFLSYAAAALVAAACGGAVDEKPTTTGEVVTGVGGASSATASSSGNGASSASSGSGASSVAGGNGGSSASVTCPDNVIRESNESEDTAYLLTMDPIDDCHDRGGTVSGVISGANDVDWFRWLGDDVATCPIGDE